MNRGRRRLLDAAAAATCTIGWPALTAQAVLRSEPTASIIAAGKRFASLQEACDAASRVVLSSGRLEGLAACVATRRPVHVRGHGTALRSPGIQDKGIIIVNADLVLEDVDVSGARSSARNGAGVRVQGGRVTLHDMELHDNENGLLGPGRGGVVTLEVERCAVHDNGDGSGYSHGLYVGFAASFVCRDSRFWSTRVGHHVKSRAAVTAILRCELGTGFDGNESYNVDAPQGGEVALRDCLLRQGRQTSNPTMVHYGGEPAPHPGGSFAVERCRFESHAGGTAIRNALPDVVAAIRDCDFEGVDVAVEGRHELHGCRLNGKLLPDRV